ncbi:FAD-binding oxidoreductase [Stigmatella erecta]|uniref:FAD/FMN-containing dehydrogenase n=1 Tax=Stigmatella erecta TaxID=83460 RepID=A0A1I0HQE0_9BACT|nr:FAD-binding oxidoreductase [Stigmatella erecta]SET86338.1 FAD/FMN-containing dehydrogenase [Stigmatella erecta]
MQDLGRRLRGSLLEPAPSDFARDFSRLTRIPPRAVVRPQGVEDVQETVRYAHQHGLRTVARGHGCSANGQTLSEHLVLDIHGLTEFERTGELEVKVGAGFTWGDLQDRLNALGLSNIVLTDYRSHTVGGTLSVGGFGSMSLHQGGQVDQVVALDIVTGTGELVHARREGPHARLFQYTLCGLGQTGLIVRAYLKVARHRPHALNFAESPYSTETLASITRRVLDAPQPWDHCLVLHYLAFQQTMVLLARDVEEEPAELPEGAQFLPEFYRYKNTAATGVMSQILDGLKDAGLAKGEEDVYHLWNDYFVPSDKADAFRQLHQSLFQDPRFTMGTYGTILRARPPGSRLPLSPMSSGAEVINTFSGPYHTIPKSFLDEYRAKFDQAIDACLSLGGRVYLYGYHPKSADFYRRQFGAETFETWRAVKAEYDPGSILGAPLF